MDGPSSLLNLEEDLTCCICLSPFVCPVTIPCGHNFCQECILSTWNDLPYSCPQCRTLYATKPELKKNTVLSTVVEAFNLRASKTTTSLQHVEEKPEEEKPEEEKPEEEKPHNDILLCDTCMEAEAAKTCFTCMASFCEEHLRPHLENPNFSPHQLREPSGDLSKHICSDHHKLLEHFCRHHGCLICTLCLQQTHKGCPFSSPEEQRSQKESEFKEKLILLNGKIQRTDNVLGQMNHLDNRAKELADQKKTELAAAYEKIREMLTQDEVLAQREVDSELEICLSKLHNLNKKFTWNNEKLREARGNISDLLSQSHTSAFLQASYDLPKVAKFDAYTPRINLDSKRMASVQGFVVDLMENLEKALAQPFEARASSSKREENEATASDCAAAEPPPTQTDFVRARPAEQRYKTRFKSPGRAPFQPPRAPDASQSWSNVNRMAGQPPHFPRTPHFGEQTTYKKSEPRQNPLFTNPPQNEAGRQQSAPTGPDFYKQDKPRNYPPGKPPGSNAGRKQQH